MHNGVITEYDEAELIFDYIFHRLNVDPSHHPLVLTEPPTPPKKKKLFGAGFGKYFRKKIADIFQKQQQ